MTVPILKKYFNTVKDKYFINCASIFIFIWFITTRPLRYLIKNTTFASSLFVGVTPNFFAAITLIFLLKYYTTINPYFSFLYTVLILAIGEFVQQYMSNHTADWVDILASAFGALVATLYILWRSLRQKRNSITMNQSKGTNFC